MMRVHQILVAKQKRHPSGWRNSLKNMEPMSRFEPPTYALQMRVMEEI